MSNFVKDEALCAKYAQFASHMVRWQFKIIYWTMFFTNLIVLFVASWIYIRGQESIERYEDSPRKKTKRLHLYIYLSLACVLVSTVIVVMEAYALLALQFCDGEDLMSLYWSTFTMIQLGSLIAMVGIILALIHTVKERRHPPWALALGTPVLVIAGLLHLFHDITKNKFRKLRDSGCSSADERPPADPACQGNAIPNADGDTLLGEFVGFTMEGGPIVRFTKPFAASRLPDHVQLLGFSSGDEPIVSYGKDRIRWATAP